MKAKVTIILMLSTAILFGQETNRVAKPPVQASRTVNIPTTSLEIQYAEVRAKQEELWKQKLDYESASRALESAIDVKSKAGKSVVKERIELDRMKKSLADLGKQGAPLNAKAAELRAKIAVEKTDRNKKK